MRVEPTLGAIFRAFGGEYLKRRGATERQRAVMRHIATCRTPALGGHKYACDSCDHRSVITWNSCRDRHCPLCQGRESAKWVDAMRQRILPTHYFHVVFTVPHELNFLMLLNKKRCYDILFKASAETLKKVLGDPKRLGAKPAFTSVLHTWTQDLQFHAHVHAIVSGGGLSLDKKSWVASRPNFLAPVKVLSRVFRGKFLELLSHAQADCDDPLVLRSDVACLADRDEFDRFKSRLRLKDWVVYVKEPLRGPLAVCKYFAGYTHRVGISNKRIVAVTDGRVRFLARHRAKDGTYLGMRELSLDADRFISRFLLHVLPRGYTRIRHYGITAPGNIKTQIPLACALIKEANALAKPDGEDDRDTQPPTDPSVCPKCGGRMLLLQTFDPVRRDPFDTS
ncbi:MAG: transposase [Phycisphaerae bacterium]